MTRSTALLACLCLLAPLGAAPAHASDAEYRALIGRGLAAASAGDRVGAVAAFREAVARDAAQPEGVCALAEALVASDDLTGALENYRACVRVARSAGATRLVARGLFGVASTLERVPSGLPEARLAWQEYVRFADGAAAFADAAVGRARITAIDQSIELGNVSAEVRQRREARRAASRR